MGLESKKLEIKTEIRLANKSDLLIAANLLRIGQPFYIKRRKDNAITGVYVIDQFTNGNELKQLFIDERVYVPVTIEDPDIDFKLMQNDFKNLTYPTFVKTYS